MMSMRVSRVDQMRTGRGTLVGMTPTTPRPAMPAAASPPAPECLASVTGYHIPMSSNPNKCAACGASI